MYLLVYSTYKVHMLFLNLGRRAHFLVKTMFWDKYWLSSNKQHQPGCRAVAPIPLEIIHGHPQVRGVLSQPPDGIHRVRPAVTFRG